MTTPILDYAAAAVSPRRSRIWECVAHTAFSLAAAMIVGTATMSTAGLVVKPTIAFVASLLAGCAVYVLSLCEVARASRP